MDVFKRVNARMAAARAWSAPSYIARKSRDGAMLRRYSRRKLKQQLWDESHSLEVETNSVETHSDNVKTLEKSVYLSDNMSAAS